MSEIISEKGQLIRIFPFSSAHALIGAMESFHLLILSVCNHEDVDATVTRKVLFDLFDERIGHFFAGTSALVDRVLCHLETTTEQKITKIGGRLLFGLRGYREIVEYLEPQESIAGELHRTGGSAAWEK